MNAMETISIINVMAKEVEGEIDKLSFCGSLINYAAEKGESIDSSCLPGLIYLIDDMTNSFAKFQYRLQDLYEVAKAGKPWPDHSDIR